MEEILKHYLNDLEKALNTVSVDQRRVLREAESHLRERIASLESEGLSPADAASQAVLDFGAVNDVIAAFSESRIVRHFTNPMHVRCGDDIIGKLKEAGLPGKMVKWCDPLSIGPTPVGLDQENWYSVRSEFLAKSYNLTQDKALSDLRAQDETLKTFVQHDAVILWFEHDLFDQIILVWLLQWFARQQMGNTQLRLICVDRFPGVEKFIGLGQLKSQELIALYGTSEVVTVEQFSLACDVWDAWCAPSPKDLEGCLFKDTSALPYLRAAIRRHLQNFPSTYNALSLTEQRALESVNEGSSTASESFLAVMAKEEIPWMGDAMFYAEIERLRIGPAPLLKTNSTDPIGHRTQLRITEKGQAVLIGQEDAIALNGIDRWVGGVHLAEGSVWRWDQESEMLIG